MIRENLEIEDNLKFIEIRQLIWWEHLLRMNNSRPAKQIREAKIQRKKRRGLEKHEME